MMRMHAFNLPTCLESTVAHIGRDVKFVVSWRCISSDNTISDHPQYIHNLDSLKLFENIIFQNYI